MANCKICGRPVTAGPVMHGNCLEQLITEAAEQLCDDYCIGPDLCGSQEQLHREHCDSCPMDRLMQLAKQGGLQK